MLLALVTLALAVGAASCGGDDEEAAAPPPAEPAEPAEPPAEPPAETGEPAETGAAPAEAPATGECPAEDGVINVFSASDLESATIGQNISPGAFVRMTGLYVDKINAEGGILGCQVEFTGAEDGFVIDECLRLYREALQSGDYDVYFGPTNSGCMAGLPDLVGAAGKFLISGIAADHQPFFSDCSQTACFKEPYYVAHASVSTFLEGRASAKFAADEGWTRPALMVPNYAYGQDVGNAFKPYFLTLVPDGEIVDEQFPEFDEDDFTPFINAMLAAEPDGILSAFFSTSIVPFMNQWKAAGRDGDIPVISGLANLDFDNAVTDPELDPRELLRLRPRQLLAAREQSRRGGVHRPLGRGLRRRVPRSGLVPVPGALVLDDAAGACRAVGQLSSPRTGRRSSSPGRSRSRGPTTRGRRT